MTIKFESEAVPWTSVEVLLTDSVFECPFALLSSLSWIHHCDSIYTSLPVLPHIVYIYTVICHVIIHFGYSGMIVGIVGSCCF